MRSDFVFFSNFHYYKWSPRPSGSTAGFGVCCQRAKQGSISSDELEAARNYILSSLRTGNDSPGRMDDFAIGQAIAGRSDTMADLSLAVRNVTMDQVVEAANSLTLDTVYFLKGAPQ